MVNVWTGPVKAMSICPPGPSSLLFPSVLFCHGLATVPAPVTVDPLGTVAVNRELLVRETPSMKSLVVVVQARSMSVMEKRRLLTLSLNVNLIV